ILDKIVILKASAPGISFVGANDKVASELPAFSDFLSHWVLPEDLQTKPDEVTRFGHDSWHHAELLQTARESSMSAETADLLGMWRTYWFRGNDKAEWRGKAVELLSEMNKMDGVREMVPSTIKSTVSFARDLQTMIAQGCDWVAYGRS